MENDKIELMVGERDFHPPESGDVENNSKVNNNNNMNLKNNKYTSIPSIPTTSTTTTALVSSLSSQMNPIINIVYHTTVPRAEKEFFETEWLPKMATLYGFNGFRYRYVTLLVQTTEVREYLVIIACSDYQSFLEWEMSPERAEMLKKLKSHNILTRRLDTVNVDKNQSTTERPHDYPSRAYLKDPLGAISQLLPPPKWKLCIVIYFGVVVNLYLWSYSGIPLAMVAAGIPFGVNLFISLSISVPILSYSFFPLIMPIPLISNWLKSPRPAVMSPIHKLLDQGLQMFAAKETPGPSKDIVAHFKKLECRLEATRRIQHQLSSEIDELKTQLNILQPDRRGVSPTRPSSTKNSKTSATDTVREKVASGIQRSISTRTADNKGQSSPSSGGAFEDVFYSDVKEEIHEGNEPVTVAVAHWVKWEHILDFERWTEEITTEMAKFEGFLGLTTIVPKSEFEPYINCFTYDSPEHMMTFIDSQARANLLQKLAPFLESDSQAQAAIDRVIVDAFTELFVATGNNAETCPPPIWKSVILTLIPLHIIVWQLGGSFMKILIGEAKLQFDIALLTSTAMTTVVNTYIGLPLMQSQFGEWLRQEREENIGMSHHKYFKFLDTGLTREGRLFVLFIWFCFTISAGYFHLIQP